jgi:16S rRNA C1402 (ribose-2'-O) methylase RsmI
LSFAPDSTQERILIFFPYLRRRHDGQHPQAPCCVARELTKKFETHHRGSAAELRAHFQVHPPKGEIVFLVAGEEPRKRQ